MKLPSEYILKLIISAYSVAALSFIIMMFRDYLVLKYATPETSKIFFNLIYISSIASMLCINFVTLHRAPPRKNHVFTLGLLSIISIFFLVFINEINLPEGYDIKFFVISILIVILWIWGALVARGVLSNGFVFLARSRELIASVIYVINYYFIDDILLNLFLSVLLANIIFYYLSNKNCTFSFFDSSEDKSNEHGFFIKLFLTNLSPLLFMFWALRVNSFSDELWGWDGTAVVRVSVYCYQALSIGVFVIIPLAKKITTQFLGRNMLMFNIWLCLILSLFGMFFPQELQVICIPLTMITLHYTSILFLQLQHQEHE